MNHDSNLENQNNKAINWSKISAMFCDIPTLLEPRHQSYIVLNNDEKKINLNTNEDESKKKKIEIGKVMNFLFFFINF